MSSDIKEELALKVISFIGPEAEPPHSSLHCTVELLSINADTIYTDILISCNALDVKKIVFFKTGIRH